jgi:hypothetical protein
MNRSPEPPRGRQELRARRQELHGKFRRLHERLAEVCEDFALEDLTHEHKQKGLVRELQYLLDYYRDPDSWKGID